MPMFREQLDQMQGCGHGDKSQTKYLHGRCHMSAQTKASLKGQILSVSCCECDAMILEAHIVNNACLQYMSDGPVSCSEHSASSLLTLYLEGDLYVVCAECDGPLTVLTVQSQSVEEPTQPRRLLN